MNQWMLFTDGSVNTKTKTGYGAYLLMSDEEYETPGHHPVIHLKRFAHTSSTKLELQTLLWALENIQTCCCNLKIYTDSQNLIRLPDRRIRLEASDYRSKKNIRLKNHLLYREFYKKTDCLNCQFIKIKGHKRSSDKDRIDHFFSYVDKASRHALRKEGN